MKIKNCPLCGEQSYSHQVKPMRLTYKDNCMTVQQPGYWCDSCGEGIIGGSDRKATQKELQTFRAGIDGLLAPDEIIKIRRKLKLTQRQASQLFGGGVNAFSRYERGELAIYRATSQLLKLLNKYPEQLKELTYQQQTHTPHNKIIAT